LFRPQIYHFVQLNSFLFCSLRRIRPCCRPSQTNIRCCVADCAIYTACIDGNYFCHFVVRTSSNLRQPAIRPESRFLPIPHLHWTPPVRGVPVGISPPRLVWKRWCGYPVVKKFRRYVIRFDMIHERDRQTDRHRMTA